MSKEKIKVYLYTRVSTTMQIDGYSLDAQKTKMKALTEWFTRRSALRGYLRIPLERNSLHASAGWLQKHGCIIFSLFASSPPVVNPDAAAVSMVWSYIGELVFNMLVLVGAVKMADRVVREMMGL